MSVVKFRPAPIAWVCFFILALIPARPIPAQNEAVETITIDPAAPAHTFPHFWEQMFGSGRAVLALRDDYRRDLQMVESITAFQYVRFHAIFQRDVGVYDQDKNGAVSYNFSYVDQIYDGLLANGVRPFVELSFMPEQLALNPQPHPFWYKPIPSPPKDPAKWADMIDAFVRHLMSRYGAAEVEKWYFEVWNEPNLDFWTGDPKQETYFVFYDLTANTIRKIDAKLRVGGPATAQAAWVDAFIAHCKQGNVPFDFVSTHIYGNESPMDVFGNNTPISMRDMVPRALTKVHDQVKASMAPDTPIIISEFNAAYLNRVDIEDSAFMGPWLADTIRACDGLISMMSYWTFSDVFEEQGIVKTPFYGGFGLVASRNIPKAAFRAFELLHQLGDQRLESPPGTLLTKRQDGTFAMAIWNYADPGQAGMPRTVQLQMKGHQNPRIRFRFVDPQHGSALAEWERLGMPAFPTRDQIAQLQTASMMEPVAVARLNQPIHLVAHELALVEWKP